MIESLNRPHDGATVDERRDFGRELLAALDRLGVQKGDPFVIGNGKGLMHMGEERSMPKPTGSPGILGGHTARGAGVT